MVQVLHWPSPPFSRYGVGVRCVHCYVISLGHPNTRAKGSLILNIAIVPKSCKCAEQDGTWPGSPDGASL